MAPKACRQKGSRKSDAPLKLHPGYKPCRGRREYRRPLLFASFLTLAVPHVTTKDKNHFRGGAALVSAWRAWYIIRMKSVTA